MNKPLAAWGLLLTAGFLATHVLIYSFNAAYVAAVWAAVILLGATCTKAWSKRCGLFRKCRHETWAIAMAEGAVLTAAVLTQLLPISPFYLPVVWMILAGSVMLVEGVSRKGEIESVLGLLWLFSAVMLPFVNNYQFSALIIGALVFGLPMLFAGVAKK